VEIIVLKEIPREHSDTRFYRYKKLVYSSTHAKILDQIPGVFSKAKQPKKS
jgi:hypothetical protein